MKKLLLSIIFVSLALVNSYGQTKYPTKEEFNDALSNATIKKNKIPHRTTDVMKFYSNKVLTETRSIISESFPPNRERILTTFEKDGKVTSRYEFITIDNVQYSKKDNENWTKTDSSVNSGGIVGKSSGVVIESNELNSYLIIPSTQEPKPAEVYYQCNVSLINKVFYFIEDRYWINPEGLIVKYFSTIKNTTTDNVTQIRTREYEYNPKDLKIEAPVKP